MNERISILQVQPSMVWEDIDANLTLLDGWLEEVSEDTDLVILPETFSTGFTMQSREFAEEENGKAVSWMLKKAREKKVFVTGSLIIREQGAIYNRLYWISPDGIEGRYDKHHLFRMGRENEYFEPGMERVIFQLGSFRFLPQICYDVRFPVFSRNQGDYDVLYYVANWPAPRQPAWEALTRARAIENQSYVLGVNRVGMDGVGVNHVGGTCAYDPKGDLMAGLDNQPGTQIVELDLGSLKEFREKFPVWKDADRFTLE